MPGDPPRDDGLALAKEIHGILVVDKESGPTSHDIVHRVRRALGTRRVGHSGTLDPFARGVLVICLGDATRLAEYIVRETKVYEAEVMFGIQTDTDDATGEVLREEPAEVAEQDLVYVLPQFIGEIEQVPPAYSAVKVDGVRAYHMARKGEAVEVASRPVHIYAIEVLGMGSDPRPRARLRITCGKGTYIRSLARDLGVALATIATCSRLTRTRVGGFTIEEAISSHDLLSDDGPEKAIAAIQPLGRAVASLPRVDIDEDQAALFVRGNGSAGSLAGEVAVWFGDILLGIGFGADGVVRPRKVMSAAQRAVEGQ